MASGPSPTEVDHIPCEDPTRLGRGYWILPEHLLPRTEELRQQDPSLTRAQCFERLGATWTLGDEGYHDDSGPPCQSLYIDPDKTERRRISDGEEFYGGWSLTEAQKTEAVRLKGAHADWKWSQCFQTAGGEWMSMYYRLFLDGEVSESKLWAHLQGSVE